VAKKRRRTERIVPGSFWAVQADGVALCCFSDYRSAARRRNRGRLREATPDESHSDRRWGRLYEFVLPRIAACLAGAADGRPVAARRWRRGAFGGDSEGVPMKAMSRFWAWRAKRSKRERGRSGMYRQGWGRISMTECCRIAL
jgi:hypothetical protein